MQRARLLADITPASERGSDYDTVYRKTFNEEAEEYFVENNEVKYATAQQVIPQHGWVTAWTWIYGIAYLAVFLVFGILSWTRTGGNTWTSVFVRPGGLMDTHDHWDVFDYAVIGFGIEAALYLWVALLSSTSCTNPYTWGTTRFYRDGVHFVQWVADSLCNAFYMLLIIAIAGIDEGSSVFAFPALYGVVGLLFNVCIYLTRRAAALTSGVSYASNGFGAIMFGLTATTLLGGIYAFCFTYFQKSATQPSTGTAILVVSICMDFVIWPILGLVFVTRRDVGSCCGLRRCCTFNSCTFSEYDMETQRLLGPDSNVQKLRTLVASVEPEATSPQEYSKLWMHCRWYFYSSRFLLLVRDVLVFSLVYGAHMLHTADENF